MVDMCGGGGSAPVDNSAEIAREEEAKRQARISAGTGAIDSAFSGYNDDFYKKYQGDYTGYYQPHLDDQYSDARKKLTLQLARTGNLTSSSGVNQMQDLQKYYDTQRTGITNQGIDAANRLRADVDARKSQLYSDNRAAADPGSATSAAANAVGALKPAMPTSPLANTFADFFSNLGNTAAAYNSAKAGSYNSSGVQSFGGSGSSARVVNG